MNYNSYHILEELGIMPNRLEKYRSFNINNNLSFIDNFPFLGSSFDDLVKKLGMMILSN